VITKQLSQRLFVPPNSVSLYQLYKMLRLVQRKSRLRKMRIFRDKIRGRAMDVGKVAATATGDQDFPPGLRIVLEQKHTASALAGDCCAHQPRRACTQHDYIEFANLPGHDLIVAERACYRSSLLQRQP
jgi:hypothetical protein